MTGNKIINGLAQVVGMILLVLVVVVGVVWLVYITINELTPSGIHILATVEFFLIWIALGVGLSLSKRHEAGIKAGIAIKATAVAQRPKKDDWRPTVTSQPAINRTVIVQRQNDNGTRLDL